MSAKNRFPMDIDNRETKRSVVQRFMTDEGEVAPEKRTSKNQAKQSENYDVPKRKRSEESETGEEGGGNSEDREKKSTKSSKNSKAEKKGKSNPFIAATNKSKSTKSTKIKNENRGRNSAENTNTREEENEKEAEDYLPHVGESIASRKNLDIQEGLKNATNTGKIKDTRVEDIGGTAEKGEKGAEKKISDEISEEPENGKNADMDSSRSLDYNEQLNRNGTTHRNERGNTGEEDPEEDIYEIYRKIEAEKRERERIEEEKIEEARRERERLEREKIEEEERERKRLEKEKREEEERERERLESEKRDEEEREKERERKRLEKEKREREERERERLERERERREAEKREREEEEKKKREAEEGRGDEAEADESVESSDVLGILNVLQESQRKINKLLQENSREENISYEDEDEDDEDEGDITPKIFKETEKVTVRPVIKKIVKRAYDHNDRSISHYVEMLEKNDVKSRFYFKNTLEDAVVEEVGAALKHVKGICKCEKCFADICALTLNALSPHYVTTAMDELHDRVALSLSDLERLIEITDAVLKAIDVVKSNPEHNVKVKSD